MFGISILEKITEEEKIAIENDFDPIEAPPGPYTVQPDVPGKKYEDMKIYSSSSILFI